MVIDFSEQFVHHSSQKQQMVPISYEISTILA